MRMKTQPLLLSLALLAALAAPVPAFAYTGPGLGLGAIGVALGLVGSILLGLASLIWYPVKRMLRRMRARNAQSGERS
jgi:hypothetical protein